MCVACCACLQSALECVYTADLVSHPDLLFDFGREFDGHLHDPRNRRVYLVVTGQEDPHTKNQKKKSPIHKWIANAPFKEWPHRTFERPPQGHEHNRNGHKADDSQEFFPVPLCRDRGAPWLVSLVNNTGVAVSLVLDLPTAIARASHLQDADVPTAADLHFWVVTRSYLFALGWCNTRGLKSRTDLAVGYNGDLTGLEQRPDRCPVSSGMSGAEPTGFKLVASDGQPPRELQKKKKGNKNGNKKGKLIRYTGFTLMGTDANGRAIGSISIVVERYPAGAAAPAAAAAAR